MSHNIGFFEARAMLEGKKDRGNGKRHKLQNNTYLVESFDHYAVRLHHTNVVEIYSDGTYALNTGGWNTVTTMSRINSWSPARVSSGKGSDGITTMCVWASDDPRTDPKIQKCRTCHGSGTLTTPAYYERQGYRDYVSYEITTETRLNYVVDGKTYDDISVTYRQPDENGVFHNWRGDEIKPLMRNGTPVTGQPDIIRVVGQVTTQPAGTYGKLREPIYHAAVTRDCYNCQGTGRSDYGSKPNPVIFYDGIRVDSNGHVIDPAPRRLIESAADKAARLEREKRARAKLARAQRALVRTSREEWLLRYSPVTTRGKSFIMVYKAVNDDLKSGWDFEYPIGHTVEAGDWEPTLACGNGLHFSRTPDVARGYFPAATRYLACEVDARTIVTLHDKIKAQRATVLYEVDTDGVPVDSDRESADTPLTHGSPYMLVL
jgi:hypothetical protein